MAYETPITIAEMMRDISANKYVLPSIQREYVWDTERIEKLFDSLMQGFPIGTFLFWEIQKENVTKYDFYGFLQNYHEKNGRHNKKLNLKDSDGVTAVLDGQQRLTSLYIGLKGSFAYKEKNKRWDNEMAFPARKLYLNLLPYPEDIENKYQFRFLKDEELVDNEKTYWFEVGEIFLMNDVVEIYDYCNENINFNGFSKEQAQFAGRTLYKLYEVIHTSRIISFYKEKSEELDKVLNIFIRVNSGGVNLSYSDLLLSIATAQWGDYDAREQINQFVDEVNSIGYGFRIDKNFVLKAALVLSELPNIAFKVDNFNKQNMSKMESRWEDIKKAIKKAVLLVSSFGYSGETLSAHYALIPIAYYLLINDLPENFIESGYARENRKKIKKWLVRALLKKVFGGHPDSVLKPMRDILQKNGIGDFPLENIIEHFKGTTNSLQFTEADIDEFLLKLRYGKSDTLSTLMLLYPSHDFRNKFHQDHIYPKSKFSKSNLRKLGVPEDKLEWYIENVDNIANLQLLRPQLNSEKFATDFDSWFAMKWPSDKEKYDFRDLHYLPDMEYSYGQFPQFLEKRRELLKEELCKVLIE